MSDTIAFGVWERDVDSTILKCTTNKLRVETSRITNLTVYAEVVHRVRVVTSNPQILSDLLDALNDLDIPHKFKPDPVRHIVSHA